MAAIIIQSRLGSTRLPKKALMPIEGKRMIDWVIQAGIQTGIPTYLVTPDQELADSVDITSFVWKKERDVLGEFYFAAKKIKSPNIIRITGDCPMLTSDIIDIVYNFYLKSEADYVYNTHDSNPVNDGVDVEIFTLDSLKEAYEKADLEYDREHVTPYIRKNFKTEFCEIPAMGYKSVNTYDDYVDVCRLMENRYGSSWVR